MPKPELKPIDFAAFNIQEVHAHLIEMGDAKDVSPKLCYNLGTFYLMAAKKCLVEAVLNFKSAVSANPKLFKSHKNADVAATAKLMIEDVLKQIEELKE